MNKTVAARALNLFAVLMNLFGMWLNVHGASLYPTAPYAKLLPVLFVVHAALLVWTGSSFIKAMRRKV